MAWWKRSYLTLYYSFLKGSWEEAIKNRFKHVRKYDAKKRRLTAPVNSSNSTDAKNEVTPVKRMKRVMRLLERNSHRFKRNWMCNGRTPC